MTLKLFDKLCFFFISFWADLFNFVSSIVEDPNRRHFSLVFNQKAETSKPEPKVLFTICLRVALYSWTYASTFWPFSLPMPVEGYEPKIRLAGRASSAKRFV